MAPRHPRLQSGGWIRLLNGVLDDERVGGHGGDHFALWIAGLTFCNRNRTDGLIPKIKLPGIAGDIPLKAPTKVAASLVRTGAWIDEGTHWRVHNYLEYQSSREEVDERRARARRRFISHELRVGVLDRFGWSCCYCGSDQELQIDHIHPIARGGTSETQNLQVLCGPCNRRKGASVSDGGDVQ